MKKRGLPLWAVYAVDILLTCFFLCVFAFFHHVREFWFSSMPVTGDPAGPSFTRPTTTVTTTATLPSASTSTIPATPVTSVKTSTDTTVTTATTTAPTVAPPDDGIGDFGETLGRYFREEGPGVLRHSSDAAIRAFLTENGLPVSTTYGGEYVGLYQSHDVFVTVERVTDRIVYETNGKSSPEVYYLYDVCIRNIENFFTTVVSHRADMSEIIKAAPVLPVAAVNGDYYGNSKRCMVAVRNGKVLRKSSYILGDLGVLCYDGSFKVISSADYTYKALADLSPYQVWCFGPSLLHEDGTARPEWEYDSAAYDDNLLLNRHPRTALGYYEPGHYCFLVVDGRTDDSYGMRMLQIGRIFEALGCAAAYNLDGGDSSQAYFDGASVRQAEGRDTQRALYDILCIGETMK